VPCSPFGASERGAFIASPVTRAEPCCGDGALVRHLEPHGLRCVYQGDVATGQDALGIEHYSNADAIITNPPYTVIADQAVRSCGKPYRSRRT
jgi:hypothetical protein